MHICMEEVNAALNVLPLLGDAITWTVVRARTVCAVCHRLICRCLG